MLKKVLLFAALIFSSTAFADYKFPVSVDNHLLYSQNSGTDLFLSATEGYRMLEEQVLNDPLGAISVIPRLFFTYQISLWNHEIIGHTFRGNEFGQKTKKYAWKTSGAVTYFKPKNLHSQKFAIISIAGNEANHILGNKLGTRILSDNNISPVHGMTYVFSQGNQIFYIFLSDYKEKGHDISSYIYYMSALYSDGNCNKKNIKKIGRFDFLDPILWHSLYSGVIGQEIPIHMISLGKGIEFLPATRGILTPYGSEIQLITYIKTPQVPLIKLAASLGKEWKGKMKDYNDIEKSYGGRKTGSLEIDIPKMFEIQNDTSFGVKFMVWKQPELFVGEKKSLDVLKNYPYGTIPAKGTDDYNKIIEAKQDFAFKTKIKTGFLLEGTITHKFQYCCNLKLTGGYKKAGYIQGYPVKQTPIIRLGFEFIL